MLNYKVVPIRITLCSECPYFKTHPEAASKLLTAVLNYLKENKDE